MKRLKQICFPYTMLGIGHEARQQAELPAPQPVRHAVRQDGVEARIGERHFQGVACGRIARHAGANISLQGIEHELAPT